VKNAITNGKLRLKKFTEGAIAFAIYNTDTPDYIPEKGLEYLLVLLVSGIKERIFRLI
jgi:hypothetical protein